MKFVYSVTYDDINGEEAQEIVVATSMFQVMEGFRKEIAADRVTMRTVEQVAEVNRDLTANPLRAPGNEVK